MVFTVLYMGDSQVTAGIQLEKKRVRICSCEFRPSSLLLLVRKDPSSKGRSRPRQMKEVLYSTDGWGRCQKRTRRWLCYSSFSVKTPPLWVLWTLPCYCPQRRQAVVTAEKGACVTVAMYGSTRKAQDWSRVCLKGQIGSLRFYR